MQSTKNRHCLSHYACGVRMGATPTQSSAALSRLVSWLSTAEGVKINPALRMDADAEADDVFSLAAGVSSGATLLSVQADSLLSTRDAATKLGSGARELAEPAALAAMLLMERAAGDESKFAAFAAAARPPGGGQPFLWEEDEIAWLDGSVVREKALEVREGIRVEWQEVCSSLQIEMSLEDYMWAQAVVAGRALALGRDFPLVLAPGCDVVPHAPVGEEPTVSMLSDSGGLFGKGKVMLSAVRDLSAGTKLTARYVDVGATSADYVLDHGFVPEGGAGALVEVGFSLAGLDPFLEDKEDILEYNEVLTTPVFTLTNASERGLWSPPEGMEPFLRLLNLGAADAFLLEAVFRNEVWGFMEAPVSKVNEEAMCDVIIAACEDALDQYGAVIPGADTLGEGTLRASRAATAAAVVAGEKEVLKCALDYYRRERESLDAKEYYQERRLKALDLLRPLDESEIVDAEGGGRMGRAFDENY